MGAVKTTVIEALILTLLGVVVAAGANAVRTSGSIKLGKNYFDKRLGRVQRNQVDPTTATNTDSLPQGVAARGRPDTAIHAATAESDAEQHPDHPYQEVGFEEVVAIFNDPATEVGANLFVDARNDEQYAEGHIPGAVQADHYRLEEYIENLLAYAEGAEKLIVYCNGGDCEDSIFLCGDLLDFDVPYEKIYLYPGGWKEWTKHGMPVDVGKGE